MEICHEKMTSVVFIGVGVDPSVVLAVVFAPKNCFISLELDTEIAVRSVSLDIKVDFPFHISPCNIKLLVDLHEDGDFGIFTI